MKTSELIGPALDWAVANPGKVSRYMPERRTYPSYDAARAAAQPGTEIWARSCRNKNGWTVMTTKEADEYAARTYAARTYTPEWSHWETIKENHK